MPSSLEIGIISGYLTNTPFKICDAAGPYSGDRLCSPKLVEALIEAENQKFFLSQIRKKTSSSGIPRMPPVHQVKDIQDGNFSFRRFYSLSRSDRADSFLPTVKFSIYHVCLMSFPEANCGSGGQAMSQGSLNPPLFEWPVNLLAFTPEMCSVLPCFRIIDSLRSQERAIELQLILFSV